MTRTEKDLRNALRDLEQRADQHGAPSTASIFDAMTEDRLGRRREPVLPRWLPPLAAAAVVAAAALTAVTLSTQHRGPSHSGSHQAGTRPHGTTAPDRTAVHPTATASPPAPQPTWTTPEPRRTTPCVAVRSGAPGRCVVVVPAPTETATLNGASSAAAAKILNDAADRLDAAPAWTTPAPQDFYYVRTTQATTWTSVSGRRPGQSRTAEYSKIPVPGCVHGHVVARGESGTCTLNDVPHYLADAPTAPPAWDAYLEHIAPGAKAGGAQGKIIVGVLHQDLVASKAAAALLRYTAASCPGLHTLTVQSVDGEKLIGVTCASMTNGSYGLAFDAASHAMVGFVGVSADGRQDGAAEIIRQTGIVPAIGRTP